MESGAFLPTRLSERRSAEQKNRHAKGNGGHTIAWWQKASGAINQVNVEFAGVAGGTKAGISLLKWSYNNIINPPAPSTTLTVDANAARFVNGNAGKNVKKLTDSLLKNKGLDAHAIKKEFLGNSAQISRL